MKLSLNCFVTTKIAFANSAPPRQIASRRLPSCSRRRRLPIVSRKRCIAVIGDIADRTPGADKHAILAAVGADSRVGAKCLKPGFGFGGPCFPRDNRALGGYARSVGVTPFMCDATDASNKEHAHNMAEAMMASGEHSYTMSDVAFKPGCPVDVIEESQPLEVAKLLARKGKHVTIKDRPGIVALVRR
eukprot:1634700-Prymnesium_polylepis.1